MQLGMGAGPLMDSSHEDILKKKNIKKIIALSPLFQNYIILWWYQVTLAVEKNKIDEYKRTVHVFNIHRYNYMLLLQGVLKWGGGWIFRIDNRKWIIVLESSNANNYWVLANWMFSLVVLWSVGSTHQSANYSNRYSLISIVEPWSYQFMYETREK